MTSHFRFNFVTPEYSGGSQYLFYGQLNNGKYFAADTDYDRFSVSFLNKDPNDIIDDGIFDTDFSGEYLTDVYSSDRSKPSVEQNETIRFWLDMLNFVKVTKPDGNYNNYDITTLIDKLSIFNNRKDESKTMNLINRKNRSLREGTVTYICRYNPSGYNGEDAKIYQDDETKVYSATYGTTSCSDKDLDALKRKLDKIGAEADKKADRMITLDSKSRASNLRSRQLKEGESYGWVVNNDEAWDALDMFTEVYGAEYTLDALARAMGTEELADNLAYIFRMHDFREFYGEDEEDYDDYDLDEGCGKKRRSQKKIGRK